jgi:phosphatidylglycerophosphate synthase
VLDHSKTTESSRTQIVRPGVTPNIPNAISLLRLLAAPVLLAFAVLDRQQAFRWLFVACLISDFADGLIARALKITSQIGARFEDTRPHYSTL